MTCWVPLLLCGLMSMWQLLGMAVGDWSIMDELVEQVFVFSALTLTSVSLSTFASLTTLSSTVLQPSSLCACVSAFSAQMGLIETTRGLLPGAGKTNKGHNHDRCLSQETQWNVDLELVSHRGQSAAPTDSWCHSGQRAHIHRWRQKCRHDVTRPYF